MSSIPIIETVVSVITRVLRWGGYPGLFGLMTVESFGIPPIPSEVILPFTGFLVAMGLMTFGAALSTAVAGALAGCFIAYAVGRWGRDWITTRRRPVFGSTRGISPGWTNGSRTTGRRWWRWPG